MPTSAPALDLAAQQLKAAEYVWIGTHLDPDGDAIGSLLGLGWLLADAGKKVVLACQDLPPSEFDFLPGVERIVQIGPHQVSHPVDVVVAVDAADAGRLGTLFDPVAWSRQPSIVLDHHISNPGFADVNVIDPQAAAAAEVVLALASAMGVSIGVEAATCLLTGILTDTIGFRTSSTTTRSLDAARRLMDLGAPLDEVNRQVFYSRPLASLKLTGRVMNRIQEHGPFAITFLTQADLLEFGVSAAEARGLTSFLATAAEPAVIALLREREDGTVDVSLRSRPDVDLVPAILSLGGGGHPQAAGARLPGPMDAAADRVLGALRSRVELVPLSSRIARTKFPPGDEVAAAAD